MSRSSGGGVVIVEFFILDHIKALFALIKRKMKRNFYSLG